MTPHPAAPAAGDGPDTPVMRTMDARLDRLGEDMREVKGRLPALEGRYALVQRRLDRVDERPDTIGKRLELRDLPV